MSKITAIVLAAGSGSRMNSQTKKQFIEIKGKPIVWYSLFAFQNSQVDEIILVTGKDDIEYCKKEIVDHFGISKVAAVVAGGKERYESVYNGLKVASGDIVLIHDGARPMINQNIIDRCVDGVKQYDAVVVGMPVKDTVKIIGTDNIIEKTPDRSRVWITQTPQAFELKLVKEAYEEMMKNTDSNVTDDAMVVEKYSATKVRFVEGDYSNIKITTPEDICIAEVLLN